MEEEYEEATSKEADVHPEERTFMQTQAVEFYVRLDIFILFFFVNAKIKRRHDHLHNTVCSSSSCPLLSYCPEMLPIA